MARNGSGTYTNPYPNFVSGTVISSTEVDTNNSQIATALTQSIAVDGQSVVTADLPLATHKFTGMKVGTAATDSLTLGQAQAEAFVWCGTATGSADAIVLTPSPPITAYAAGQRFVWMASSLTNTTATTVAISGLSAIALQDNGAALTAGQHAASKMFMGILNTTSTVQIMQVQVSGTDPLIVTSLTVTGDATIGDDLTLLSDAAVLGFGVDSDVTLRHMHDTGLSLSAGANRTQLEVISTDDGASKGPTLELTRDSASPAASDSLGNIKFIGKNDADENVIYAEISTLLIDPADGAEDGRLDIEVMRAGSLVSAIALKENEIELNAASIDINGTISGAQTFSSRPVLAAGFVVGTDETTISSYYNSGSIYMGRDSDATYYENSGRGIFIYDAVSDSYTGVRMYDTVSTSPVWRHQIAGIIYSEIEATGDFESKDTQYLGISDARLKENIIDSGSQWDDVKAMRFRKYSFISDNLDAPNQLGVIAQELEASGMAGLVKTKPYTNPPKDGEGPDVPVLDADGNPTDYKSVSYSILYMKAAKALQEAMERIETLEAKVTALENA